MKKNSDPTEVRARLEAEFMTARIAQAVFFNTTEVDQANLIRTAQSLNDAPPLSNEEKKALALASSYDDPPAPADAQQILWRRFLGSFESFASPVHYFSKLSPERGMSNWGKAVTFVDAPAETVAAWLLNIQSYERKEFHKKSNGAHALRAVWQIPNSRTSFSVSTKKMVLGVNDRFFTLFHTFEKLKDGSITIAFAPVNTFNLAGGGVRVRRNLPINECSRWIEGTNSGVYFVRPIGPHSCKLTHIQRGTLGGNIPIKALYPTARRRR